LDIRLAQGQAGRAAIDHTAYGRAMRFAEGGHSKKLS
jgi:hypothetical protein